MATEQKTGKQMLSKQMQQSIQDSLLAYLCRFAVRAPLTSLEAGRGGDPTAGSPTVTLLRLHPSHESQSGKRPPEG